MSESAHASRRLLDIFRNNFNGTIPTTLGNLANVMCVFFADHWQSTLVAPTGRSVRLCL